MPQFKTGMLPYRELSELNFLEVLIAIVISWIIIDLWLRVIENFAYRTIGLSEKSTIHTLVVALAVTIIFITFVFSLPSSITDLIIGEAYSEEDVYGISDAATETSSTNSASILSQEGSTYRSINYPSISERGESIAHSTRISSPETTILGEMSESPVRNVQSKKFVQGERQGKFLNVDPGIRRGERLVHNSVYYGIPPMQQQSVEGDISISRNIPHDVGTRYSNDGLYGSQRRRHRLFHAADWTRGDYSFQY